MRTLAFAPEFRVRIDGEPVPAALRASISAASFQTGFEGADRVELTLVNERLRWLDHPLLRLDATVALSIGYAPDPLEQVFVGDIVGQTASFPSGGIPTLTVAAQDRRHRLQHGARVRWFGTPVPTVGTLALQDPVVASTIALDNGFVPLIEPVGAALAALLGAADAAGTDPDAAQKLVREQLNATDLEFLQRIARENGWEMLVDHRGPFGGSQLRFMSPLDHVTPDVTLEYGRSLVDFTPRVSTVGQLASVTAYVWIAQIKRSLAVTIGWDWDRMALTVSVRPADVPALGASGSSYLIEEPLTPASAPRRIISELVPRLNQRLTGTGTTIGNVKVMPGAVVRLEGLGTQFGGFYRVTSATHAIDGGGYRTTFEARKEIWFGSIPLPQQGAVAVKLT